MTASMLRDHDSDNPPSKIHPPERLSVVAMVAIVVAGIAAALIAQGVGLSFRLSIAVSALIVGVLIAVLHYFQDSRRSSARSRDGHRPTIATITTAKQPKTSRAQHR